MNPLPPLSFRKRVSFKTVASLALLGALGLSFPGATAGKEAVRASRGEITLPTYPWWPALKHPYFRGTDKVNIYPYPMLDNLSREKQPHTWRTVVLENEFLRVTFLPELGGRIHEVLDKTTGQPMFYVNHVIKPGLIGQCGAWISGGVEWNTGPQGHTVSAVQPVEVEILPPAPDGSRSVVVGELERIYHTRWTVWVTLRPGRAFLEERVRIYNGTETVRPYYFWNCTAMPNTPGFRFIYPMTLGSDHSSIKFFRWPLDQGRDLTRGTNYQDASSIFAWHCDQDFFGSYDDGADRGVVAYANHRQVPGKKAWTWGQGSFGRMHQMDLTDQDGPYNEVQTGPLLTQGEVGRLDPSEAVSWEEWWYPLHGLGGFTFANRDLAANVSREQGQLRLKVLATGSWSPARIAVLKDGLSVTQAVCQLSPRTPAELSLGLAGATEPLEVEISASQSVLARFRVPLDLPVRQPPGKAEVPQSATELAEAGWQDFLFAKFSEAEGRFRKALEKDPHSALAHTGLAYLQLDSDPAAAAKAARAALATVPDNGRAAFALAVAEYRLGQEKEALDDAWRAALDPATAVAGRALAAKILLRQGAWEPVVRALSENGPWQADPVCRDRLALALQQLGRTKEAAALTEGTLRDEPLDAFARSLGASPRTVSAPLPVLLDLVAEYHELGQIARASALVEGASAGGAPRAKPPGATATPSSPLLEYWRACLAAEGKTGAAPAAQPGARAAAAVPSRWSEPVGGVWPDRWEDLVPLRRALERNPADGQAALYLGDLLFALGRQAEGRAMWQQAAKLGAAPTVALRSLGMASLTLDNDLAAAAKFLEQANQADPADAIIARDLAKVLFNQADKAQGAEPKRSFHARARDTLQAALAAGRGRSDFVALLARARNRLGEYAETARLLDAVRIIVWEGAREAHDLFEEAHLELGKAHLAAGRAAEALAEFDRALEYPENLATGKLEHAREAHVHYLRGNALAALGRMPAARAAWKTAAEEPPSDDPAKQEARQKAKAALEKPTTP